jgi:hypothetical protein
VNTNLTLPTTVLLLEEVAEEEEVEHSTPEHRFTLSTLVPRLLESASPRRNVAFDGTYKRPRFINRVYSCYTITTIY